MKGVFRVFTCGTPTYECIVDEEIGILDLGRDPYGVMQQVGGWVYAESNEATGCKHVEEKVGMDDFEVPNIGTTLNSTRLWFFSLSDFRIELLPLVMLMFQWKEHHNTTTKYQNSESWVMTLFLFYLFITKNLCELIHELTMTRVRLLTKILVYKLLTDKILTSQRDLNNILVGWVQSLLIGQIFVRQSWHYMFVGKHIVCVLNSSFFRRKINSFNSYKF